MGVIGARTGAWAALLACTCVAGIGCGSDDSDGAADSTGLDSEPARLVRELTRTAATAKGPKDCKEVAKVNIRSQTKVVCPPLTEDMRRVNQGMRLRRAATYGAAAVVDYTSPGAKDGASVVLYRNPENQWILGRWGLVYGPTVGTDDGDSREETRETVDRYLDAVRQGDCAAFNKYAVTQASELSRVCKNEFPATRDLAKALKAAPDPAIAYVGGNEDLAFFRVGLGGARAKAYTVSTVATPEGSLRSHVVLDASPAPPS
jgi:hypothetical protein